MDMQINVEKFIVTFYGIYDDEWGCLSHMFPYQQLDVNSGVKYLGFVLQPNDY
jgi:hypothetical protein